MSFLLNPYELKDNIIKTLNIVFDNCTNYPNNFCYYNKKNLNDHIDGFLNNNTNYINLKNIDVENIYNSIKIIIQNKMMNKIRLKHKELLLNTNLDYNLFNTDLLSLSINKPYNEELYKSTIAILNNGGKCLHFRLNDTITNLVNDNIPYIWFSINNLKKEFNKTINNNKEEHKKEIEELKEAIKEAIQKEINRIDTEIENEIDDVDERTNENIKELKETIDNNKQEHQKEIQELKETINNNKQEHQKEIQELKETIDNNKQEHQKEIKELKKNNINFQIIIFLLFTYQIIFKNQ
jgi:hypothetical protein